MIKFLTNLVVLVSLGVLLIYFQMGEETRENIILIGKAASFVGVSLWFTYAGITVAFILTGVVSVLLSKKRRSFTANKRKIS